MLNIGQQMGQQVNLSAINAKIGAPINSNVPTEQLYRAVSAAEQMVASLASLTVRLCGAVPAEAKNTEASSAGGIFGGISLAAESLQAAVDSANRDIARIRSQLPPDPIASNQ